MPFFVVMCEFFNGVLQPKELMPAVWRYTMYYIGPFTYWISGIVAMILGRVSVRCLDSELIRFEAPPNTTCGEYANDWLSGSKGYLENPSAFGDCGYCQYAAGEDYLDSISLDKAVGWPYLGIFALFTVTNYALFGHNWFSIVTLHFKSQRHTMEKTHILDQAEIGFSVNRPTALYTIFGGLFLIVLHAIYRSLLPRPFPGIPYNKSAVKSLFGDGPELTKFFLETGEVGLWLSRQIKKHNSPIFQAFVRPFSKPWVVIADFQESQDICLRRAREFDRSPYWADIFAGLAPLGHIHFPSNSVWKGHRRLLQDLMLPAFLKNVAAPAIYSNALDLLHLWQNKCDIANGRPFDAEKDIFYAALDAVTSFSFGASFDHKATAPQLRELKARRKSITMLQESITSRDAEIKFPKAHIGDELQAVLTSTEAVEGQNSTLFPRIKWWRRETFEPGLRNACNIKRELCRKEIFKAVTQLEKHGDDENWARSAIDLMVRREKLTAAKEGREPQYYTDHMIDEVFVLIVAGHDTTSTTIVWGIKFLADHQDAQRKLRAALQVAHPDAFAEKRNPTTAEIMRPNVSPYLDATIEEIVRLSGTSDGIQRVATVDTEILGHPIPKGTELWLLGMGPSMLEPAFKIDDKLRSESSQKVGVEGRVRAWDETSDMAAFTPERWIQDENGKPTFDALSGPSLTFGLGTRGCYGRKLAYVEMRLIFTLIIWNFELLPCPPELSGYEAITGVTRKPQKAYARLQKVIL
ncbi:Cytochrome P450 monooxygenase [Fusarium keratoplasticum]|uniref:Cytochrome P450 monooxygenase n=1 Tax=Fusarium keratoplasticum TaxID=1328300 RepID=A0ACC0QJP9_9HYPO|nr:Cytochrome P450 monooxygenase [Fusarium keratoplasticum]KAI8654717.1 Cytochrome P450 monooxygenase [Fusarium keratoplasticum]